MQELLLLWWRIVVKSVEVEALWVHPIVTLTDAIRIDHRNYLEDEKLSQNVGLKIVVIEKKVKHTL